MERTKEKIEGTDNWQIETMVGPSRHVYIFGPDHKVVAVVKEIEATDFYTVSDAGEKDKEIWYGLPEALGAASKKFGTPVSVDTDNKKEKGLTR